MLSSIHVLKTVSNGLAGRLRHKKRPIAEDAKGLKRKDIPWSLFVQESYVLFEK